MGRPPERMRPPPSHAGPEEYAPRSTFDPERQRAALAPLPDDQDADRLPWRPAPQERLGERLGDKLVDRLGEELGGDFLRFGSRLVPERRSFASGVFTVLGQVNRPGSYDMPEDSPRGIDLLEAIAIAGGYTHIAAPERVSVKRRNQIMRVDAKKLARLSGREGSFLIEPGDTITIGESIF